MGKLYLEENEKKMPFSGRHWENVPAGFWTRDLLASAYGYWRPFMTSIKTNGDLVGTAYREVETL
jgi:hypothetical protein